jgi:hypothetical protein
MIKKNMLPALLLLSLLAGCGGSQPSPEEVIALSIDAINELQTYRYEMAGTITQDGETSHGSMQGEFVSPDRLHVITVSDGETSEGIRIGQTQYARRSDSDDWEVSEWSAAMVAMASPHSNFALVTVEILDTLVGLVELPDEKIDGVSCFHYRGNIDMEAQLEEQIANLDPTQPGYEEQLRFYEQLIQSEHNVEFWIGKEDYLLRRMDTQQDVTYTDDIGKDTESEVDIHVAYSCRFYDFNQSITIEPPVTEMVESANLTTTISGGIGGTDLQHQQIHYEIRVTNRGTGIARNLRIFVDSPATNSGLQTMEAEAGNSPVNLGPDEYAIFLIQWEYDMTESSKAELFELVEENVFRAIWTDENGEQREEILPYMISGGPDID